MVHSLKNPCENSRRLTQSVLQIIDMLGIYRAELARVLHIKCEDVGFLVERKRDLELETDAWDQAVLFVRMYEALFVYCKGDGVAMCHWLRSENKDLKGVPMLLMVDDDKLSQVLGFLESNIDTRHSGNNGGTYDRLVKWTKSRLKKKH
ncbi:MAG: hypothetical protein KAR30_08215 [Gammaproteobacteria bacterium]|nr:hypothetical protein [Gammaproteobacteria bacterium]